ncbi:MAG: hypothetical protein QXJ51_01890 [Sulfolobales archaeon]
MRLQGVVQERRIEEMKVSTTDLYLAESLSLQIFLRIEVSYYLSWKTAYVAR